MDPSSPFSVGESGRFQVLWEDGERVFCRGARHDDPDHSTVLAVLPAAEHPSPATLDRLAHEYGLKDELDGAWAARPLDFIREGGRTMLVLEDSGFEPLGGLEAGPMEVGSFLLLAISIVVALAKLHGRGLVHKDIKPANILVDRISGDVKFTGFGLASRLPRERQSPEPPEIIAGTLAYMAPEQTGRMNRSIDSRSDLYALGVTLYQMLTAALPFRAAEPMEWVHCHIARRPMAPVERLADVPPSISAIIMKLLAKTAEDRYQTATGLEHDLRRCLAQFEAEGRIDDFALGARDTPDRLLIPEKLYGRAREIESLLAAFDRIVQGGAPQLVLVSGYSGVGKSAVVNELHKVLVPPRGLFAAGKFDQYKRDVPYSTLAQAFQTLVRSLLAKSDMELGEWREALCEALGPNGQLMVDLVPELKLIIGEPPPVPELPPQDAQRRFQLVFRKFICVFAQPKHPLALFLDDLQWLDAATLDLLEDLLSRSDLHSLLLIGAFRDNEVTVRHPLMRKLEAIRASGRVQDIRLAPLTANDLGNLVADSLRCEAKQADPLAVLVHVKTEGNPFFVIQFLHVLADEGLLAFDHEWARWVWDLGGIHAKRYADNVLELLVGKLARLPLDVQNALRQLACLGNAADVAVLSIVLETPEKQVHAVLWEAVRQQFIERLERSYKFVHDRVQEAAYALIPERSRAEAHLTIGRLLLAETPPPEKRHEAIFQIVNPLNRGAPLMTSQDEREQLAELNLAAGKRAKASSAYASAMTHLTAGVALLPEDAWERRQEMACELELHLADCELCTGALPAAEERLAALATRTVSSAQRCVVARRRVDLYAMLGAGDRAVTVALECLRHVGIDWSAHPTEVEARSEYERFWSLLGNRTIEDVVDLPLMQDPEALATQDLLTSLLVPALYTDVNLLALSMCKASNLGLERGNSDGASANYAGMGMIAGGCFGDYDEGYRLGKMACDLLERRGLAHFSGRTYAAFAVVVPGTRPLREGVDPARRAVQMAKEQGDPAFVALDWRVLSSIFLAVGHPLDQVEREAVEALEFMQGFELFLGRISVPLALVRMLRGRTTKFGSLDDGGFTERSFEERATGQPMRASMECYYWMRKLQARFFAGDYASAIDAAEKAGRWYAMPASLSTKPGPSSSGSFQVLEMTDYHFYAALSHAASYGEPIGPDASARHQESLARHERELQAWAARCPQNFEDRAALVRAEIARIEGRPLDAADLYERAIASARANGFVHNEALANELAARFYAARGFETIARAYLSEARACYLRWGADGKVRQLETLHPYLREADAVPAAVATTAARLEQLELATVVKVSQAVSGEIVLESLIHTLMRTALEEAGAERGLLIIPRGAELRVVAEATTSGDKAIVRLRDEPVSELLLPESVLHFVTRTHETVLIDDAGNQSTFAADPYIRKHEARSILCLPLLNQAKSVGVLFLENNLAPGVFTSAQVAVLKLVSSQAAIALENSRLYADLQEREAKIQRLVDGNIVGILTYDLEGRIMEANDAFLRIVGYDREDLALDRLRWTDLTPPEWRDRDAQAVEEVKSTSTAQPFEKEYFRKDGSRVPVLVGAVSFEEAGNQGIAFVLDLTERKRAEAEASDSERRYREAVAELAHANRVATMGQLTASIAHEVNQPLTATIGNAGAALRWLARRPPDLEEVRELLVRIAKDGHRAATFVERIRNLVKKAPPRMQRLELNAAIGEVLELTHGEAIKNNILVKTRLAEGLPAVVADRTEIQQVLLNLIINAVQALSGSQRPRELVVSSSMNAPSSVLVSVQDTGPGISPENLARLFDPFYTTKPGGMGMGLSICRSIIEAHEGRLWATANAPQGAAFHFTIPIAGKTDCFETPVSATPDTLS